MVKWTAAIRRISNPPLALVSAYCLVGLNLASGKKVIFKSKLARLTCIRMVLFGELDVSPPDLLFGCRDWEVQCFKVGGILGSGWNASETHIFLQRLVQNYFSWWRQCQPHQGNLSEHLRLWQKKVFDQQWYQSRFCTFMTFLQSGDQILCVVSGRVMKAWEADGRDRAALYVEQLIKCWTCSVLGGSCFFPHL